MTDRKKSDEKLERLAIVSADRCKPRRCALECKKCCPVNRRGALCIEVEKTDKMATISEDLCIGCSLCQKRCPFQAIQIINLPKDLEKYTTHRYGPNSFKLHRMPIPRPNEVLGLVGANGIGKSTAIKILAGKLKPNLGDHRKPPDWEVILKYFRGSELQNYFQKIVEDKLKAIVKPQYVDLIKKAMKGKVSELLKKKDDRKAYDRYVEECDLKDLLDRNLDELSGGELQRFTIALACVQFADIYMFDEPSSYLDVKQRMAAAETIRAMLGEKTFVLVVEHDLSVLDYLSDYICVLYGVPGAYGVVTMPFSVREGINIFLNGHIPTENLRFRNDALSFKITDAVEEELCATDRIFSHTYPKMTKSLGSFHLTVESGGFTDSEIIVLLGENGTGKTTFIRVLAGMLKPDNEKAKLPELNISIKPQTISPKFQGTVKELFDMKIKEAFSHPQFSTDVLKPLLIEQLCDRELQTLSGGELQRVAITLALGKPADVYLLDEPSAFLDSEQRMTASKVIKRYILHAKKTAFVVEHDFIMATYLADRVIVYEGTPGSKAKANSPQPLLNGMNQFLKHLAITFRKDEDTARPRINKKQSVKDREQKSAGTYFFMDATGEDEAKKKKRTKLEKERLEKEQAEADAAESEGGEKKSKEKAKE